MNQMHLGNAESILQKHAKQRNFAMKEFAVAADNLKDIQIRPDAPPKEVALAIRQYTFIPSINPFDDHMVHIMCHNEYLLDKYWEMKASGNMIIMELLANMGNHLAEHQQIVLQQQQAKFERDLHAQMLLKKATNEQIVLSKISGNNNQTKEKGK